MEEKTEGGVQGITLEANVLQKGTLFSFPRRNVVEAAVLCAAEAFVITGINFTTFVMCVYLAVFIPATFILTARGYKNRSFLQVAFDYAHVLRTRKRLHFRGPEYMRQDIKIQEAENADRSIAEKFIERARGGIDRFVDEYGQEEAGAEDRGGEGR